MTDSDKDPEIKLIERARQIAVYAEPLATSKKCVNKVSRDGARNARKDVVEAIATLTAFHALLTNRVEGR